MLNLLKGVETDFYAIHGLYSCEVDDTSNDYLLDYSDVLAKLDEQIKIMEEANYDESN